MADQYKNPLDLSKAIQIADDDVLDSQFGKDTPERKLVGALKPYTQGSLTDKYKAFLKERPDLIKWQKGRFGDYMDEKYMSETIDPEFLKYVGHNGDVYSFEESNPGTSILKARLKALDDQESTMADIYKAASRLFSLLLCICGFVCKIVLVIKGDSYFYGE